MRQITIGYIPQNWKPEDSDGEDWIELNSDSSGTLECGISITDLSDSNGEERAFMVESYQGKRELYFSDIPFDELCGKVLKDFFGCLQVNGKQIFSTKGVKIAFEMVNEETPDADEAADLGFTEPECVAGPEDGYTFKNEEQKYNGYFYIGVRTDEQVADEDDGPIFVLKPLVSANN